MTMKPRKMFALLLAVALVISLYPTAALAAGPIEVYGGGGGGGGGGGAASTDDTYNQNTVGGDRGIGGASVGGGAGGFGGSGGTVNAYTIGYGGGGGGGAGAGTNGVTGDNGGNVLLNSPSKGTPDAGGNATDGAYPNGGRGGDGTPGADQSINDSSADPSAIKVYGGNGGGGGGGGSGNGAAAQGGRGGDGGAGGDARLMLTAPAVACTGPIEVISGRNGNDGYSIGYINGGTPGAGGSGGAGGDATLGCPGTLSAPSITVTQNDSAATATIGMLLVAQGSGTTVTNNSGTVNITTVKFDSTSTSLDVTGSMNVTNVSLTPPATANGNPTGFSATGFVSGTLSVHPGNLNINVGETITLLETTGGVPASWDGLTFGDYTTEVSGQDLLLHRVKYTPVSTPKPPSSLPKTGDGFPLGAVAALLGAGVIALAIVGMRLRKQRKGE